jgi:hypothetical protein
MRGLKTALLLKQVYEKLLASNYFEVMRKVIAKNESS